MAPLEALLVSLAGDAFADTGGLGGWGLVGTTVDGDGGVKMASGGVAVSSLIGKGNGTGCADGDGTATGGDADGGGVVTGTGVGSITRLISVEVAPASTWNRAGWI